MLSNALTCGLLLWGSSLALAAPPSGFDAGTGPDGRPVASGSNASSKDKGRRLTGRFLHITDFHPDPFYKTYSSTTAEAACHRQRGPAGVYGAETSGCDSPYSLINQTFDWIKDNIKDDIDFVIWTGDSARHDIDEEIPRTQKQILQQNQFMVDKFAQVFGQDDDKDGREDQWAIPVVPTFGNNDIMPHNIFLAGPNRWTRKYLDIWRSFIPEAQRHQFQQGGWFSVEVIPRKLAVISLNTIYFFTSNSGVDGCAKKSEPGFEHMEWLRIQLQILRERNMKAILMGHVPPARVDSKESWDETCWQKYTLWQRQFRDVIVGNLYGHMNIDHFMVQDFDQISKDAENGRMAAGMSMVSGRSEDEIGLYEDGEVTVASASDYLLDLREAWAQLPAPPTKSNHKTRAKSGLFAEDGEKDLSTWSWLAAQIFGSSNDAKKSDKKKYLEKIGGKFAERYSTTLVAPSVVPNYYPTLRIIEYNITGLENLVMSPRENIRTSSTLDQQQSPLVETDLLDDAAYLDEVSSALRKKKKGKKGPRKYKFRVPDGPSASSPPGPAYSPQPLTWTRYVQYYANLTHINNDFVEPDNTISTTNTQHPTTIFGISISHDGELESSRWKEGKHHKHQGKQPRPTPHPNNFTFQIEYDTRKDGNFKDLTVRRWVEYARRLGSAKGGAAASALDEQQESEDAEDIRGQMVEESTTTTTTTITTDADADADAVESDNLNNHDDENFSSEEKKHRKKKGKKKKKHHTASKEWFTFVKRAFVGTMDPHEIKQVFGAGRDTADEHVRDDEVIEL